MDSSGIMYDTLLAGIMFVKHAGGGNNAVYFHPGQPWFRLLMGDDDCVKIRRMCALRTPFGFDGLVGSVKPADGDRS